MQKSRILLISVLAIWIMAFGLRLMALEVPVGIAHDELDYVVNAKWLILTGSDLSQTWQPAKIEPIRTSTLTAELTPVVYSFFLRFLPLTLVGIRLMTVFISSLLPLAVILWMMGMRLGRRWAVITGLLIAVNPWSQVFSHTAYEAPLSLVLHFVGLASIVWLTRTKNWRIQLLWLTLGSLCLVFGFYTYHGYKVLTLPLIVSQVVWLMTNLRQKLTRNQRVMLGLVVVLGLVLTFQLFLLSRTGLSARSSEVILFNQEYLSRLVDSERRQALDTSWQTLFSNKLIILVRELGARYFDAVSLKSWFMSGDDGSIVLAIWRHGFFYVFEAILFCLGIAWLISRKVPARWLLLALLLVAPLPAAIQMSFSHALRAALLVPVVCTVTAYGLVNLRQLRYGKWITTLVVGMYLLGLINFLFFYWNSYPVITAESFVWRERLVSNYLQRVKKGQSIIVLAPDPFDLARAYTFYNIPLSEAKAQELSQVFTQPAQENQFVIEGILFTNSCAALPASASGSTIVFDPSLIEDCKLDQTAWPITERLAAPSDSRDYFKVSGVSLCESYPNPNVYVRARSLTDFSIEKMALDTFCQTWTIPEVQQSVTSTVTKAP